MPLAIVVLSRFTTYILLINRQITYQYSGYYWFYSHCSRSSFKLYTAIKILVSSFFWCGFTKFL